MSDTGFDETPPITAGFLHSFAQAGMVNLVGGCCGTTPPHIAAIAQAVAGQKPRDLSGLAMFHHVHNHNHNHQHAD
jgi:5-methyltetrahydrofolate--homocysteine methyltransferase